MPTKPNRADYAPNRSGQSAYLRDLRAYEAAVNPPTPKYEVIEDPSDPYGYRLVRPSSLSLGSPLATLDRTANYNLNAYDPSVTLPTATSAGNAGPAQSLDPNADAYIPPINIIKRNVSKPTGNGTQTSPTQPSPDEMFAFLGAMRNTPGADAEEITRGRSNLATFARPFADLVTETEIDAPEVDMSVDDLQASGYSAEDIATLMAGSPVETLIDESYEPNTGMATTEDINKAMRARQKRLNDERMRKQEMEKIESAPKSETAPQSDDKTDYMVALMSPEQKRRTAFLDAPDSMSGLKRREMMRGYITAGGQKYAITPEFIKSGDAKDLGPVLTSQQVAQAKAQELLDNTVENVTKSPAVTQTPMLGEVEPVFEGPDPAYGKISKVMPENEGIFVENNATEFDLNPLGEKFEKMSADYNYANRYPNMVLY